MKYAGGIRPDGGCRLFRYMGRIVMKFKDRVVLVTGSTRGIGKGIAEAFAAEGAHVIINGVTPERVNETVAELKEKGYAASGSVFDTADFAAVMKAAEEIKKEIGAVEILVNNAGISPKKNGKKVEFRHMDAEDWNRVVDVNLNGVFNCCRAVINDMIEAKYGKIINISSAFARYYAPMSMAHYMATKTAVLGLTRSISGETCQYGINCNAVAPGRTWTEMTRGVPEEVNQAFMKTIPAGRFAEVEEMASAVLYLASDEAAYIHGATIDVNGGACMV